MAVKFLASGDYLGHAMTNQMATGTMCCWFRMDYDPGVNLQVLLVTSSGDFEARSFGILAGTGNNPMYWDKYGIAPTLLSPSQKNITIDTWYWGAFKWTGGVSSLVRAATLGDTSITSSWDVSASDTVNVGFEAINIGVSSPGDYISVAHARFWSAELSDAELLAEMKSTTAVRTSNLYAALELVSDASNGQSKTFNVNGSPSWVAQPDLSVYAVAGVIPLSARLMAMNGGMIDLT